ncbi:MAG TPA: DMT family transporter [Firmicutes bacterium]|nr:DMT family transporter [Bacillota bacterium]
MENGQKRGALAKAALLVATLIWGSTFIIFKDAMNGLPPLFILAFRYLVATVILSAVFFKKLRLINKTYLWQGAVLGVFLAAAYIFQTYGLQGTTPGKNAFLTAVYCVLVPFVSWAFFGGRPDRFNFLAAATCLAGIGFVSLDGDLSVMPGDWLTLVGGVFFALHIAFVARFNSDKDAVTLTLVQFFTAGVICGAGSLCFETLPSSVPPAAWTEIIYLAVCGTAVAMLLQNVGQKYVSSSSAAIILSLEALFGVLFSVIFGYENLSVKLVIGFALIFFAIITSETKWKFVRGRGGGSEN